MFLMAGALDVHSLRKPIYITDISLSFWNPKLEPEFFPRQEYTSILGRDEGGTNKTHFSEKG